MREIVVQCGFDPPEAWGPEWIDQVLRGCRERPVVWRGAAVATDGRRALLWFRAGGVELVREALGSLAAVIEDLWLGTVEEGTTTSVANVVVEQTLGDPPTSDEEIPRAFVSGEWCRRTHRVHLVRRTVSRDGRRVVLLVSAPDAESVRVAERHARRTADAIWAFEWLPVGPWDLRRAGNPPDRPSGVEAEELPRGQEPSLG